MSRLMSMIELRFFSSRSEFTSWMPGSFAMPACSLGAISIELLRVAVLERILILAARQAPAEIDVLNRLEIGDDARDLRHLAAQPLDHLVDRLRYSRARAASA